MNDQSHPKESGIESDRPATPSTPIGSAGAVSKPTAPATPLTPEEQMALFEKDLKENDWGHQPC